MERPQQPVRIEIASPQPRWYAVQTRARHEKRIECSLRESGIESFLPLITEVHHWSDRRKEVTLPLFPCYVFVRIPAEPGARLRVLRSPGVLAFVGQHGHGAAIPDQEIEGVRSVIGQAGRYFASPFLKAGQRVRIRGGALDGVEGILSSHKGAATLVVSVELIQRSVSVVIEGYGLEAA